MPRKRPPEVPGVLYHIYSRGNDHGRIVLDDIDRTARLQIFAETAKRYGWKVSAFVVLDNHDHYLIELTQPNRGLGMAFLNGKFARRFNRRHGRSDHVFGKRYGCKEVVTQEHLESLTTYIPANPVIARLCERAEDYRWSSFAATVGLAEMPSFLDPGPLLEQFGRDPARARARYMAAVERAVRTWPERPRPGSWHRDVDRWYEP